MDYTQIGWFVTGLLGLYFGAEWMVVGSSRLAISLGIKPIVIGLTVVAFGTSSPELAVSLLAVFEESDGIAIGNIIGSNIANIGLILGVSALVSPLKVELSILRRELPIMIGASLLFIVLLLDGQISFLDGGLLFAGLLAYLAYHIRGAIKSASENKASAEGKGGGEINRARNALLTVVGMALLIGGANLMVDAGIVIARTLGISEVVIGIALVAVGTSLPELATSIISTLRSESDISVGNIIGSNIFNIMCVIGLVAMVMPLSVNANELYVELAIMMLFSFALIPFMKTGFVLNRIEGAILLAGYCIFIIWLFI